MATDFQVTPTLTRGGASPELPQNQDTSPGSLQNQGTSTRSVTTYEKPSQGGTYFSPRATPLMQSRETTPTDTPPSTPIPPMRSIQETPESTTEKVNECFCRIL